MAPCLCGSARARTAAARPIARGGDAMTLMGHKTPRGAK